MRAPRLAASCCLLAALALGVSACGDDDGGGGGEEPAGQETQLDLTIGDLVPLSGDLADQGPAGRKAADLALEEIEQAVEEVGADHTVEVLHEDTQTNPQAAVQAARTVTGDGASCIAGAWASADTLPVGQSVSIREEVLQLSPASTSDEITTLDDDGFVNRTVTPDAIQGIALANLVEQELGGVEGTVVNIGTRDDSYGTGLAGTFRENWEERGGEIGEEVVYDPQQPSYDSEAQQIVSGSPDGFVIVDFPETYGKVGPALARTGNFDPSTAFVTDGLVSTSLPKDVGQQATEGLRGTVPGAPEGAEASEAFDTLFEESSINPPEQEAFDAQNFDAVMTCYLSAVAAGSAEGTDMAEQVQAVSGPPGDRFTFEQLPEAIEALQNGDDIDYEGASGPIDLDDAGDPTAGVYDIFAYRNGKFVPSVDQVEVGELEGRRVAV